LSVWVSTQPSPVHCVQLPDEDELDDALLELDAVVLEEVVLDVVELEVVLEVVLVVLEVVLDDVVLDEDVVVPPPAELDEALELLLAAPPIPELVVDDVAAPLPLDVVVVVVLVPDPPALWKAPKPGPLSRPPVAKGHAMIKHADPRRPSSTTRRMP
jgi:hypothetical protein